jgi:tetratricopeptide (TPR) repeat protein
MQDKGNLIVLSDGQATCQQIRPIGTYNYGQLGKKVITVSANQCGSDNYKIKYYTIGLNIAAGSPAERDLQYLSQISGGKYLNVQSQTQLERAFRKFNRIYVPKPSPYSNGLPTISTSKFDEGVSQINTESFSSALKNCEEFSKLHPDDCHGAYNLALMQEANDFYKNAITNYQKYLSLCPSAPDKEFVEKQIAFLEEEFRQFLLFQKEVVKSDLEYLKIHFDKIQNGQSVALAEEFKGFLKEKGDYYKNLSELTGKNSDRIFKKNCQEVALGLDTCAKTINRNPSTWDRDATPSLSMTYLNLERLLEGF